MIDRSALVVGGEEDSLWRDPELLDRAGLIPYEAASGEDAIQMASQYSFDIVLLEEPVEDHLDIEAIRELRRMDATLPVIVLSSGESMTCDDLALNEDLVNILPKTIDSELLLQFVRQAVDQRRLSLQYAELTKVIERSEARQKPSKKALPKADAQGPNSDLIGEGAAIREVRRQIEEVAPTDISVLIRGETGTGKDVVARLVHKLGAGANDGPFIKICCPALPEQLLESELFGHEAGSFTGATRRKPGRLELAQDGSVFLDEITEMPPSVQAKLLEVLEHKTFMRVGGDEPIVVDTRIIAATNVSLQDIFEGKRFRQDLFYRLDQYSIEMPALRERADDIPLLVEHFLAKYGPIYGKIGLAVDSDVMARLVGHTWPGNVRELESLVRRYALTGKQDVLVATLPHAPDKQERDSKGTYQENEKRVILEALSEARWNRRKAAEILGISYNTLRRRIAQYDLS